MKSLIFTSREGNFSINFPGKPIFSSLEESTEYGKITENFYIYKKSENEVLVAAYANIPKEALKSLESFEGEQSNSFENIVGPISLDEFKLNYYNGNHGFFFKAKVAEEFYITAQIYLIKDSIYLIAGFKKDGYFEDKLISRFIASFRLLSK